MSQVIQGQDSTGAIHNVSVDTDGNIVLGGSAISVDVTTGGVGTFVTGTATTASATVTFSATSNNVEVNNTDTAIVLLVSLDGTTWIEIDPESSRSWSIEAASIRVKSASATVAYEIVYTVPSV